jgi:hypothetical protein
MGAKERDKAAYPYYWVDLRGRLPKDDVQGGG